VSAPKRLSALAKHQFSSRSRESHFAAGAPLHMVFRETLECSLMARWILAALTALFLAATMIAGGAAGARAAEGKTAIFAGGCFWCVEDAFDQVDGVTETISGYAGGTKPNPTYGSHEGYVEAVKVTYDPDKVSYAKLLDQYWHNIDPFDPNGQFCDQGPAYHTVVFVNDDAERTLAEKTKAEIVDRFKRTVATEIKPVTTFTPAEAYHQNYHTENPVSYKYYKWGCGRAQRLAEIWGPHS
jgi:peptide-methionine (S)-S-oxide reductase